MKQKTTRKLLSLILTLSILFTMASVISGSAAAITPTQLLFSDPLTSTTKDTTNWSYGTGFATLDTSSGYLKFNSTYATSGGLMNNTSFSNAVYNFKFKLATTGASTAHFTVNFNTSLSAL